MAFGIDDFLMLAGGIGTVANTIGNVANAAGNVGRLFGGWGQTGQSQSAGGSTQQGGGSSQSMSKSGTNDEQVMQYLKGAYQYQNAEGQRQSQFNQRSMLEQMGYNTLGAIAQGIYNHIENTAAMNLRSKPLASITTLSDINSICTFLTFTRRNIENEISVS